MDRPCDRCGRPRADHLLTRVGSLVGRPDRAGATALLLCPPCWAAWWAQEEALAQAAPGARPDRPAGR